MTLTYGTVCSGIESPSVAWHDLGFKPVFFSEIEKYPSRALKHHYPDVPNLGDMTLFKNWSQYAINILCGGTPCQSFSIAGLRKGMDDVRGNLAITFGEIAARYRPQWLAWENVPGVLTSENGEDFASFLGLLSGRKIPVPAGGWRTSGIIPGYGNAYGLAYRVLDAQYFGVAQRRRRVFVVGYLGDWRPAAAVLFERESLSGNPAPRREKKEDVAGTITAGAFSGGAGGRPEGAAGGHFQPVGFNAGNNGGQLIDVADTLDTRCKNGPIQNQQGMGVLTTNRMVAFGEYETDDMASTVKARDYKDATDLIAFSCKDYGADAGDISPTLRAMNHDGSHANAGGQVAISYHAAVRRLTPVECERLQGFPDNYTKIKDNQPDGPRYKALGNTMAVPVMKWIGERIQIVDDMMKKLKAAA